MCIHTEAEEACIVSNSHVLIAPLIDEDHYCNSYEYLAFCSFFTVHWGDFLTLSLTRTHEQENFHPQNTEALEG